MTDNVNKPNHYTFGKYECIDVLTELCNANNLQGVEGFLYGNIIKYLWRYKHKNGIEDLNKAKWYLERLIAVCAMIVTISLKRDGRYLRTVNLQVREDTGIYGERLESE